jgi:hypothetical protein
MTLWPGNVECLWTTWAARSKTTSNGFSVNERQLSLNLYFSPQAQNNGARSERDCVVLDQPQRLNRARRLRLVFDTAALR